jgi:transcriptional regulator with XRE-family HTH domain
MTTTKTPDSPGLPGASDGAATSLLDDRAEEGLQRDATSLGDVVEPPALRLVTPPIPALPMGDRGGGDGELLGELGLGQTGRQAEVSDAVTDGHVISLSNSKDDGQGESSASKGDVAYEEEVRRYRPGDPPLFAPPDWKQRVRDELKKRGISQEKLARDIGATSGGISQLLGVASLQHSSKFVIAISAYLDWPVPVQEVTPEDARALDAIKANPDDLKVLEALRTIEDADPKIAESLRTLILDAAAARRERKS